MIKLVAICRRKNDALSIDFSGATEAPIGGALQGTPLPDRRECSMDLVIEHSPPGTYQVVSVPVRAGLIDEIRVGQKFSITVEPA